MLLATRSAEGGFDLSRRYLRLAGFEGLATEQQLLRETANGCEIGYIGWDAIGPQHWLQRSSNDEGPSLLVTRALPRVSSLLTFPLCYRRRRWKRGLGRSMTAESSRCVHGEHEQNTQQF